MAWPRRWRVDARAACCWRWPPAAKSRIGLDRALAATGLGECFAITARWTNAAQAASADAGRHHRVLGADKRRTLMVGDTTTICRWRKTPAPGALASATAHPVEALRDCAPLACFDSFAEFDTWLTPRLAN